MTVSVEFDVPAPMRDGTLLRANVYRPSDGGPWPTLLARLPYGKDQPMVASVMDPIATARRGFMVVVQDSRGRFASEGDWTPFRDEARDGYDTVEWAARLPGSNGRVGMWGASYWGSTQWMAALERPPSLAAISPALTWADPMEGLFGRGGAVELGFLIQWDLANGANHISRLPLPPAEVEERIWAVIDEFDALSEKAYWELPVQGSATLARHGVPDLGGIRVLDEPEVAAWSRVAGRHHDVDVPTLHTGGWNDCFLKGTLDNYTAMSALRPDARLVVGPWTHWGGWGDLIGDRLMGLRASRTGVPVHPEGDLTDLELAWFKRYLTDEPQPEAETAPVRIFVMGANAWRDEPAWPLARAVPRRMFLHADGSLGTASSGEADEPSTFTYDPADPVPTIGGATAMLGAYRNGPFDQSALEARPDVLVFTSEPLEADLEVTGPVRAVLHVDSTAPSTDWVVRLCDVHPDGRSFNLCDGILRVATDADRRAEHEVDLWATSNVFLAGHRLRVHVTSSSFPRWDRNLNTGQQDSDRHEPARQRVYHDAERASFIELPVIPEG